MFGIENAPDDDELQLQPDAGESGSGGTPGQPEPPDGADPTPAGTGGTLGGTPLDGAGGALGGSGGALGGSGGAPSGGVGGTSGASGELPGAAGVAGTGGSSGGSASGGTGGVGGSGGTDSDDGDGDPGAAGTNAQGPGGGVALCTLGVARACGECLDGTQVCIDEAAGTFSACMGAALQPQPFFFDSDQDGFGDPEISVETCEAPEAFVGNADDCCDSDVNANPTQAGFFPAARNGCGGFDYNCDGAEELAEPAVASCATGDGVCFFEARGWFGLPPACGVAGDFIIGDDSGCFTQADCDQFLVEDVQASQQSCR